ncbi:MAG: CPBP family intramembrane metalloprotease [Prevotellaceae bacterium]|jgi:membrane protease YdiL (CAAX protease family)|nr:CPBP family intramembrane metalloprotease [Prevotellaceae bacterium]
MMQYLENILGKDNSFWKYIVVILVTIIAISLIGGMFTGIALVVALLSRGGDFSPETFSNIKNLYDLGLSENFILVVNLIPFVVGLIALWLLVTGMHKRTFAETVNGTENIRWGRVFTGFAFWFLLMLVFLSINCISDPDNFVVQFDSSKFIPLLIIALLFIPLQTTFEEYMFRGYLAQGIATWTKNRWLVILIPGILFGLLHYTNTEVAEHGFWVTMPQYIIFGLFFGLIAVLDDGIELPVGMHAANNIFVCLFVTNDASSLRTPAILRQLEVSPQTETVSLLIAAALTVTYFYYRYKWNFNILNEKVKPSNYAEQIF